ncbi:MAG: helix-turn-helix domain-containing protein [Candidatus Aenigmatarchaeota archaeon]
MDGNKVGNDSGRLMSIKQKLRYDEIYKLYIGSELSEAEVARVLGISERTVIRAIKRFVKESDKALGSNKELLKVLLDKVRGIKQKLIMELNRLSGDKYAAVRIKYYSELRKNTELEARLLGLLKGDNVLVADKMVVIHNIGGNDDKENVIEVEKQEKVNYDSEEIRNDDEEEIIVDGGSNY